MSKYENFDEQKQFACRVIADHARATAFAIADGILPGNEGRNYVLRKIMRRAIYHGREHLGLERLFFHKVCGFVVEQMKDAYPELGVQKDFIDKMVRLEEERFGNTLTSGLQEVKNKIDEFFKKARILASGEIGVTFQNVTQFSVDDENSGEFRKWRSFWRNQFKENDTTEFFCSSDLINEKYPSRVAFVIESPRNTLDLIASLAQTYDTKGVPRDLVFVTLKDNGFEIEDSEFEKVFDKAIKDLQANSEIGKTKQADKINPIYVALERTSVKSNFHGYDNTEVEGAKVLALVKNDEKVDELNEGDEGLIVLDETPFYAEAGGQVGDRGTIVSTACSSGWLNGESSGGLDKSGDSDAKVKPSATADGTDRTAVVVVHDTFAPISGKSGDSDAKVKPSATADGTDRTAVVVVHDTFAPISGKSGDSDAKVKPSATADGTDRTAVVVVHDTFAPISGKSGDSDAKVKPSATADGTDRTAVVVVHDTFAPISGIILHKSIVRSGSIRVGDTVTATVDEEKRDATRRNHTATHLVHAALKEVLGTHVKQGGSVVAPTYLRFDYTHYQPLTADEIGEVEVLVNRYILQNEPVNTNVMAIEEAMHSGAVALFGEKYGSDVRVLSVGNGEFSKELCGGTHVRATGDIGSFKITSDESVASGLRRIRAITGFDSFERFREDEKLIDEALGHIKTQRDQLPNAIEKLQEELKKARKENDDLKMKIATGAIGNASNNGDDEKEVNGVKVVARIVDGLDKGGMRHLSDTLLAKMKSGVVVLARTEEDKVSFIVRVSDDLTDKVKAGKIVQEIAPIVGGRGGGKPDMAEGGGTDAGKLQEALEASYESVKQMLN